MAINFMRSSAISSLRREPRGRAAMSMIKLLVKDEIRRFPRPNRDHSRTLADGWDRRRVRFRIEGFVSAYRFSDTANLLNQTPLQGLLLRDRAQTVVQHSQRRSQRRDPANPDGHRRIHHPPRSHSNPAQQKRQKIT